MARSEKQPKIPHIGMVVAGGLENSGGIGRVIDYILDDWKNSKAPLQVRLYDPRGKKVAFFPVFLLATLSLITWRRLTGRLDLLHINLSSYASTFRKYFVITWGRLLGIPIIVHLHGSKFKIFHDGSPTFVQKAIRKMLMRATHIVVLGDTWRDFIVGTVGIPAAKVSIIPNGVPRPQKIAHQKQAHSAPLGILFLGRLGTRKGVPELLEALAAPEVFALDWHATFAGDGDVELYKREAETKGLTERIEFPGWVGRDETQRLLSASDLLVLPSHAENLPISVLEGLANSLAIITTPVGAIPELLTDEKNALIVPVGDSKALTLALMRAITDKKLREQIAKNGFALFENKIDIHHAAVEFLLLYQNILR